ncbi:MAG: lipoprotein signal peptidase [Bacteroidales bacterium]|jgi:signal peptidase II|nr:lipoprotein signal peptidase [Bacteroidales bacterium]MCI1784564.1 lipoprotein signal peptidase [Bacteroidales bacterium]
MKIPKGKKLLILGALLVIVDQVIKILVKTNMAVGDSFPVIGHWFRILFIENEGMAFGMKFGGVAGKFLLTLFRLALFGALCWWITKLVRQSGKTLASGSIDPGKTGISRKVPDGVLIGLTLITAGALGNIIDSLFYGLVFSESAPGVVASFGGHYAPLMFGKVVDMFYFPLIDTTWPSWIPVIGGHAFRFFEPIFNFADSCVTVGAFYLIIFQYKFFSGDKSK